MKATDTFEIRAPRARITKAQVMPNGTCIIEVERETGKTVKGKVIKESAVFEVEINQWQITNAQLMPEGTCKVKVER